jgi:hypothetical protein
VSRETIVHIFAIAVIVVMVAEALIMWYRSVKR